MPIAIKPRGIARGQMHSCRRQLNSLLIRQGHLQQRTGQVYFGQADTATLAQAVTVLNSALNRKGDVSVP